AGGDVVSLIGIEKLVFAGDDSTMELQSILDTLGSPGNDTLRGTAADDLLEGGAGNDSIAGNGGDDTLVGGAGADILRGGAGDDLLQGGTGGDTYHFGAGDGHDVIQENDGTAKVVDTVVIAGESGTLAGGEV